MKHRTFVAPLVLSGATLLLLTACATTPPPGSAQRAVPGATASPDTQSLGRWYYTVGSDAFRVEWAQSTPVAAPTVSRLVHTGAGITVAPGGRFFLSSTFQATTVFDEEGHELRRFPSSDRLAWSPEGTHLCRLHSTSSVSTADVLTPPAFDDAAVKVPLPTSPGALGVTACDVASNRLLLTVSPSFASTTASFLINLRDGSVVHQSRYPTGTVLIASGDVSRVGANCAVPGCTSELFDAATGSRLLELPNRQIRGISTDDEELVTVSIPPTAGNNAGQTVGVDLRSVQDNRVVWSATASNLQGAIPGPAGLGFALGLAPVEDVYGFDILYVDRHGVASTIAHHASLV